MDLSVAVQLSMTDSLSPVHRGTILMMGSESHHKVNINTRGKDWLLVGSSLAQDRKVDFEKAIQ